MYTRKRTRRLGDTINPDGLTNLADDASALWSLAMGSAAAIPAGVTTNISDVAYDAAYGKLSPSQVAAQTALEQNDLQVAADNAGNLDPDFVASQIAGIAGDNAALATMANNNPTNPGLSNLFWITTAAIVTLLLVSK